MGSDVAFAMDAAASELYSEEDGMYHFPGEAQTHAEVDALRKFMHMRMW